MWKRLDLSAAVFTAIAALFWFWSAETFPQMAMYWGLIRLMILSLCQCRLLHTNSGSLAKVCLRISQPAL
jgi:hypothetical protein